GTLRWDDAQNWDTNALPGSADDAVISSAFSGLTITHDAGDVSIRSLTSAAGIRVAGGTFALGSATSQIDDALTVSGGSLLLSSPTLNGPGTLTNAAGPSLPLTSSTMNAALVNQGTIVIRAGATIAGSFTTTADSTLTVQADGFFSNALLTVSQGFTNLGLIDLTCVNPATQARMDVTSGT